MWEVVIQNWSDGCPMRIRFGETKTDSVEDVNGLAVGWLNAYAESVGVSITYDRLPRGTLFEKDGRKVASAY